MEPKKQTIENGNSRSDSNETPVGEITYLKTAIDLVKSFMNCGENQKQLMIQNLTNAVQSQMNTKASRITPAVTPSVAPPT